MAAQNSLNNRSSVFTITTLTAGVVQSSSAGLLSSSNGSNGQILIGGGSAPAWANITSSSSTITVTSGANTINLEVANPVIAWTDVTGTSQSAAVNAGYTTNNAGLVTVTLPSTAAYGSVVYVVGKGAGGWKVAQNAGQTIHFLGTNSTAGTGGSLASTTQYDSIELLCTVANTDWTAIDSMGNITIV